MAELSWLTDHRIVGTGEDMLVHDPDDVTQSEALGARITDEDLLMLKRIRTFGPDTIAESRNRGFRRV